jgi:hypothetical protein
LSLGLLGGFLNTRLLNALGTLAFVITLGLHLIVPLQLLAARRRVSRFMAVSALLSQKCRTNHNPIGTWLVLHPVTGVLDLTLASVVTDLAIGLGDTLLASHVLLGVVAVGVHFLKLDSLSDY